MIDIHFTVDSCSFVILHPADHPHLAEEGTGLYLLEDDIDALLERGLLLGLRLGADGHKGIRVVVGPLPEDVRADLEGDPFVFRLRVRHGRMLIADPSYDFPTPEELARPPEEIADVPYFDVPNGRYRASIYTLKTEVITRENVIWLLTLEQVESFSAIEPWREFPYEESKHRSADSKATSPVLRVRHAKYGLGWVKSGTPAQESAVLVAFDAHGEKKILGRFLELVQQEA